jgi:hypothetical protein
MRIRMLTGLAGEGRQPGDVLDLPPNEARALVEAQRAEVVRSEPLETPERGQRPERAVKKQQAKARETRG